MITRKKYIVVYEDGEHRIKEEWIDTLFLGVRLKREINQISVKGTDIPVKVRDVVYKMDNGECAYCGIRVMSTPRWAIDHISPQCQYGTSYIFNLTVSCSKCNGHKGGRTPQEAGMTLLYGRFKRNTRRNSSEPWLVLDSCPLPEDEYYLSLYDISAEKMNEMYQGKPQASHFLGWERYVRDYNYGEPFTSEFIRLRGKTLFRPGVTLD